MGATQPRATMDSFGINLPLPPGAIRANISASGGAGVADVDNADETYSNVPVAGDVQEGDQAIVGFGLPATRRLPVVIGTERRVRRQTTPNAIRPNPKPWEADGCNASRARNSGTGNTRYAATVPWPEGWTPVKCLSPVLGTLVAIGTTDTEPNSIIWIRKGPDGWGIVAQKDYPHAIHVSVADSGKLFVCYQTSA